MTNLSSVSADTDPERFEDTVKGLDAVGCGRLGKGG